MPERIGYAAARVFDGRSDAPLEDAAVVVEGERIAWVGPRSEVPADVALRELGDATLLPGLIDCHAHLFWDASAAPQQVVEGRRLELTVLAMARHARQQLERGVTTVRDLGAAGGLNLVLAGAVEQGLVHGPRVVAAGSPVCMTGGHGHFMGREADGPDEVRKAVREQLRAGARCIKLMASGGIYGHAESPGSPQLTVKELRAGAEEAHKAGVHATAHAYGPEAIRNAVEAGIDCIEHGSLLDAATAELMARAGVWLVPTLSVYEAMATRGAAQGAPAYIREKTPAVRAASRGAVRLALEAGVRIAAGTDCGSPGHPHGSIGEEVRLLAEAGLSPMQALRAATSGAAELLGLGERLGTLAAGYEADLLVVAGDALQRSSVAVDDVRLVVMAGRVVAGG